jgi:putative ABC transport system substrate-binding protein
MDRRAFFLAVAVGALAGPMLAHAQPRPGKQWRIGFLGSASIEGDAELTKAWDAFRLALKERGYVEGTNLSIDRRYSGGKDELFPSLATDLVKLNPDLILTATGPAALAVRDATSTIPIVVMAVSDPVGRGLVTSLAHPGTNVTGISELQVDLIPKRLELLKSAVPNATRVLLLSNPGGIEAARLDAIRANQVKVARSLGVTLLRVELVDPQGFDKAIAEIARLRPDALLVGPPPVNFIMRREIAEYAAANRLPTIASRREQAVSGMLMTYGASNADTFRNAANYVDKIFKGAKPADLPLEQPTKFELVINLRTAKAIGLAIPKPVLERADEVIQ